MRHWYAGHSQLAPSQDPCTTIQAAGLVKFFFNF